MDFLYAEDLRGVLDDFYLSLSIKEDYNLTSWYNFDEKQDSWIFNFSESRF